MRSEGPVQEQPIVQRNDKNLAVRRQQVVIETKFISFQCNLWSNLVKKALISGITGQDGSYLAEFLLGKGYEVMALFGDRVHSIQDGSIPFMRIRMFRIDDSTWCMATLTTRVR